MRTALRALVPLLAVYGNSAAAEGSAALESLSRQLAAEKSKPQGARSESTCPEDTAELHGLSRAHLHKTLGAPDGFIPATISPPRISAVTYFISPKPHQGSRRGGHPQITFHLDPLEQVTRVTCSLAE